MSLSQIRHPVPNAMETKLTSLLVAIFAAALLTSCLSNEPPSEAWRKAEESVAQRERAYTNGMAWPSKSRTNETVMVPGMRITADVSNSRIAIEAHEGYERSYTWDDATRSAILAPRKIRWYGSFGIYSPGVGNHWRSNGGITRGVLEEGVLWFKTTEDAVNWLKDVQSLNNCVYSKGGLVVAWEKVPARKQLNVDVWQLMIGGDKPAALPGSRDEQIKVTHSTN
jgi:hypothetical protein